MKPGPFEDVKYNDPNSKFEVTSVRNSGNKVDGRDPGLTKVSDSKGQLIWSGPFFVGRHELQLSPRGDFLALIGNFYFGSQLQLSRTEQVVEIYENGHSIKTIRLSDLFNEEPETIANERRLAIKGGGWVHQKDFILATTIDWSKRNVRFTLYTEEVKTQTF